MTDGTNAAATSTDTDGAAAPVACDLDVFTVIEGSAHRALSMELRAAVRAVRKLPAGLALDLDGGAEALVVAARWAALEARCCSFWRFDLALDGGQATLTLTGPEGAADLLASMAEAFAS